MSWVHCWSSSFDRRLCKFISFLKQNLLTDLKPFLSGNLSFGNKLTLECVFLWVIKYEFPTSSIPEKCSVGGEGGGRGKKKITVQMNPSPSPSVNDFECFGRKTKIENWLQFSIFNFSKPCHRLQHGQKSKIAAQFNFSLYCWQD